MVTAVVVLASVGLYNSVYFTLLAYSLISPSAPVVPAFCRLGDDTCRAVVHTRPAKLMGGIPNALFGCFYYVLLLISATTGTLWTRPALIAFAAVAAFTVLLAAYLIHQLYAVLHKRCPLCLISHGVNAALFAVALIALS